MRDGTNICEYTARRCMGCQMGVTPMPSICLEGESKSRRGLRNCRRFVCTGVLTLICVVAPQGVYAQCTSDADCEDNNPCTDNECILSIETCWFISNCADPLFCNGTELCCTDPLGCGGIPVGTCVPGTDVTCPVGQVCSEPVQGCVECEFNIDCDDGNQCTEDTCNAVTGCQNATRNTLPCDDGVSCTENDTCNSDDECVGVDIDCTTGTPECFTGVCVGGTCDYTQQSDGSNCQDTTNHCFPFHECQGGVCVGVPAEGCMDMELRLAGGQTTYSVGDVIEVQVWVTANGCPSPSPRSACGVGTQAVAEVDAVIEYVASVVHPADPQVIGSRNPEDPCDDLASCDLSCGTSSQIDWGSSLFPNDCVNGDAINAPCLGTPSGDGDLYYLAFQEVRCNGEPAPPACVSTSGLFVTTIKFVAIAPTAGVSSPASIAISGCVIDTRSKVLNGDAAGDDITGSLGAPVAVEILCTAGNQCPFGVCTDGVCVTCPPLVVEATGPRYAAVTPVEGPGEVAIYVEGVSPKVRCISGHLNSSGVLKDFVTWGAPGPGGWDTVQARGMRLIGGETYNFYADCDAANPGVNLSTATTVTLWRGGDADNSGSVDIGDAVRGVDGFRGRFHLDIDDCTTDAECVHRRPHQMCDLSVNKCLWITIENVDSVGDAAGDAGCVPNGAIGINDIVSTLDFFRGFPDRCNPRCP